MKRYRPRVTPWIIDEGEFYELESFAEQMKFLLRYAILAPSGHNTQPWAFRVAPHGVDVYADYTRRLAIADRDGRELLLSVGAAVANFRVAAAHFGFCTEVEYTTRPEEALPLAHVRVRESCGPDAHLASLFPAIQRRRTNRRPFAARPLDPAATRRLSDFLEAHREHVQMLYTPDKQRAAELVEKGDRMQMASAGFRGELADWLRAEDDPQADGMSTPFAGVAQWLLRNFDLGGLRARVDRELVDTAAALLVVTAPDGRPELVRAGETVELLLLTLTLLGIDYSFLNQPVEVEPLRDRLWSLVSSPHPPQLLLRIGYGEPVRVPAPRRPLEGVMV